LNLHKAYCGDVKDLILRKRAETQNYNLITAPKTKFSRHWDTVSDCYKYYPCIYWKQGGETAWSCEMKRYSVQYLKPMLKLDAQADPWSASTHCIRDHRCHFYWYSIFNV